MARTRRQAPASEIPTEPFPIETGWARFVHDPHTPDSLTLEVNGVPSSQMSLSDPSALEFEYMQWMTAVIEAVFPRETPLRAMHLGAGACALPRAVAHVFPAAKQIAVDVDPVLADAVRAHVPLPRAPRLRLRVQDARAAVEAKQPGSADVIVRDVFAGDRTPGRLADTGMAALVERALAPGGIYLVNCGDGPRMELARREVATLRTVFDEVSVIAEPGQFRGRRRGNVVLVASPRAMGPRQTNGLVRRLRSQGFPARMVSGSEALEWAGGARPLPTSSLED